MLFELMFEGWEWVREKTCGILNCDLGESFQRKDNYFRLFSLKIRNVQGKICAFQISHKRNIFISKNII
jgi:hypothetical protein